MIAHGYVYKGIDLDSTLSLASKYILQGESKKSDPRTQYQEQAFAHATRSSQTWGSGRRFDLSGILRGSRTEAQSSMDILNGIIQPEYFPSEQNRGFYELSRFDHACNRKMKSQAKVVDTISYGSNNKDITISFAFALFSEIHWYYGYEDKTVTADVGLLGGVSLVNQLAINQTVGGNSGLIVNNEGNFASPMNIKANGELVNPVIYNHNTGTFYKLTGTFQNLSIVFDDQNFKYDILDGTTRVAYLSTKQSLEGAFQAVSGVNYITVTSENYSLSGPNTSITIDYNDAFDSN